ncbi:MAG: hypothetical protein ABIQ35_06805 [Verrucomicrobiota bacterium]
MKYYQNSNWVGLTPLLCSAVLLTACNKSEIKVYSVPKEKEPVRRMADAEISPTGDSHPIHWLTPTGWKELAPTSIRVGNFLVTNGDKKAEVTIIQFPGEVGGELENVNRWRGEVNLSPVTEDKIAKENVVIGKGTGKLYEFVGPASKTVAAILEKGDIKWFFKMRGDKEVVSKAKPDFVEFLKSISFHDEEVEPVTTSVEPPAAPNVVSTNVKKVPEPTGETAWEVPPSWQEKAPSPMVLKSFSAGEAGHEAKISITRFPGDVGGALANVNRWRNQISLPPIDETGLAKIVTSIDVLAGKATLVDMKSSDGKTRLIAASVARKEQTWFYKLMGDEATVAREKEVFIKFVQSVRYPNE